MYADGSVSTESANIEALQLNVVDITLQRFSLAISHHSLDIFILIQVDCFVASIPLIVDDRLLRRCPAYMIRLMKREGPG